MNRTVLLAVVAAGMTACTDRPSPIAPTLDDLSLEVIANERMPFSSTRANPCTGELVAFEGDFHVVSRSTDDGNNGFHIGANLSTRAVGVGLVTGNSYRLNQSSKFHMNAKPPFPSNVSSSLTRNVISQGSDPNFVLTFYFHTTVNANGELSSFKLEPMEAECRG